MEGEKLEDRRSVGASIYNSGDGTDQRVQSLMFMMMKKVTGQGRKNPQIYLVQTVSQKRVTLRQFFSTFVRPRPCKLFFHKTRGRAQQIYS